MTSRRQENFTASSLSSKRRRDVVSEKCCCQYSPTVCALVDPYRWSGACGPVCSAVSSHNSEPQRRRRVGSVTSLGTSAAAPFFCDVPPYHGLPMADDMLIGAERMVVQQLQSKETSPGATSKVSAGPGDSAKLLRDILQGGKTTAHNNNAGESGDSASEKEETVGSSGGEVHSPRSVVDHDAETNTTEEGTMEDEDLMVDVDAHRSDDADVASEGGADEVSTVAQTNVEPVQMKRARVENIVSNMLSGPNALSHQRLQQDSAQTSATSAPATVNGCKKRKLYQPRQQSHMLSDNGLHIHSAPGMDDADGNESDAVIADDDVIDEEIMPTSAKRGCPPPNSRFEAELRMRFKKNNEELLDVKPPRPYGGVLFPGMDPERLASFNNRSTYHHNPGILTDMDRLVAALKSEIAHTLSQVIDDIVSRYAPQPLPPQPARREPPQLDNSCSVPYSANSRDLSLLTAMLDRKSPRTKVIDRGGRGLVGRPPQSDQHTPPKMNSSSSYGHHNSSKSNVAVSLLSHQHQRRSHTPPSSFTSNIPLNVNSSHHRHDSLTASSPVPNAANILSSSNPPSDANVPEQTEAMSLVVTAKKKRHKVTDTRVAPRRSDSPKYGESAGQLVPSYPPPPLVPVSLNTSVAIPNPSLHHAAADLFSLVPYHQLAEHHRLGPFAAALPPHSESGDGEHEGAVLHSTPVPPSLLLPGVNSNNSRTTPESSPFHPLYMPTRQENGGLRDNDDNTSEIGDLSAAPYNQPEMAMMQFLRYINGNGAAASLQNASSIPSTPVHRSSTPGERGSQGSGTPASETSSYSRNGPLGSFTSTLTPMHLRKAKLMFFYVRYPSSAILKMYFPDINFNKNNTAQLVKWFSNFREFYYIQMEKYARQAISEGVRNAEEIRVGFDSELIRVLNLHYNRNNHIDIPEHFRFVVEQTLREFFKAILAGKDQEQSWKKAIYKIIARLDDNVPEYFKSPNFLEQLE